MEATRENTKSGALDAAAEFYLSMAVVDAGRKVGALVNLIEAAEEHGALTDPEIASLMAPVALVPYPSESLTRPR